MVRLGLKPGAAGWKVHTNPLSYGGTPQNYLQLKECVNKEGYYECGCFEGFELDAKKICVPVPTPEPINNCPDNCSHSCHQGQCTCPEDMVLTADGINCRQRHHKKPKANVSCDVIDYDVTSMEIHYSKPANADGKYEKGTVARGKCRSVF